MISSLEVPTCFEDIDACERFFILGEGESANTLHALLAGRYGNKFFGYLSAKNESVTTDRRTSYPVNIIKDYLPNLNVGDFVFLLERSNTYETMLLEKGVRCGHSFFFLQTNMTYETPAFHYFLKCHLNQREKNNIALDIGANFGITAAMMSRYCHRVLAFEPNKSIFKSLSENKLLEKNICIENIAFGDKKDRLEFFESPDHGNGSLQKVLFNGGESYYVDVTTIDEYCASHQIVPDVIKVDAEGVDLKILKGASQIIKKHRPKLYFENPVVSPLTFDQQEWEETLKFLDQYYTLLAYPGFNQPFPQALLGAEYYHFINHCDLKSPLNIGAIPK